MNRYRYIGLVALGISSLLSCHSSKQSAKGKLPGVWQGQPIVVDGYNKDWPLPFRNYDSSARIGYAMSNDKDNLYLAIETTDAKTQMKIVSAGMTVWIDTGGKEGQKMAIHYPATVENASMPINRMKQGDGPDLKTMDRDKRLFMRAKTALADAQQISFEGFYGCNTGFQVKQVNSCGIVVRMEIDDSSKLVWEASIPFKTLYGNDQINKRDAGRPISVCFHINAFAKPEKFKEMSARANPGAGADTTRRRAGKMAEQLAEMAPLFEPGKTCKTFGLAYRGK